MLSRVCCLLSTPKSPKLIFLALLTIGSIITVVLLFFADFRSLLHSSVFPPHFEEAATFHRSVPRFRAHRICPSEGINNTATIFVLSPPEHIFRRQVIRSTWDNPKVSRSLGLGVVFVVEDSKDSSITRLVDWEAEVYGDVLQFSLTVDSDQSLTLKTLAGLKWVIEYCPKSNYAIKVDEDIFVNVFALSRFLKDSPNGTSSSLMCMVWNNMPVIRRKKTVTRSPFNGTVYPTYCSGSAYIMSLAVAKSLHNASSVIRPVFWLEDIYVTGVLAKQAGISHKQIGYVYAFQSRNTNDLEEGKIIFAHLDDEKSVPEVHMWEKVFAYENKQTNHHSIS